MGADANLFLFDYAIYRESILPAFLRLMLDGTMEDWLRELLYSDMDDLGLSRRFGCRHEYLR